jgi:hypothetical protein
MNPLAEWSKVLSVHCHFVPGKNRLEFSRQDLSLQRGTFLLHGRHAQNL